MVATLDPQQQLEAFTADGEEVEAGKVIARTSGFADVLLAGERVALNLLQHLSGVATITRQFVRAVEGTNARITDTRKTMPGLRMLEKYSVLLGGGVNHRYGLDDGVFIKSNHIAIAGGVGAAVKSARDKIGHIHRISVEVRTEGEIKEAIESGAGVLVLSDLDDREFFRLSLTSEVSIEPGGAASEDRSIALEPASKKYDRLVQTGPASGSAYHDIIDFIETRLVSEALAITNGNQVKAAEILGVRTVFYLCAALSVALAVAGRMFLRSKKQDSA